jgi:two-component system, NarL family, nitrate/nitrite response regulator NarL
VKDDDPRVLVVDDHALFAEALVMALSVVGIKARHLRATVPPRPPLKLRGDVLDLRPDLVLLDLDLGAAGDGMRLIPTLVDRGISVIVVTGSADQSRWGEALFHGASVVIPKSTAFGQIVDAVRRFRSGLPAMSRDERSRLLDVWRTSQEEQREIRSRFAQLTRREEQVLQQLMAGRQVSEIARRRVVSEATVRTQVKAVLAKLQVPSQLTAVSLAHRVKWRPTAIEARMELSHDD